jgi:NADH-quinone oxidoreductase subunit E
MSVRRLGPNQPTAPFAFTPENLSWAKRTISKYPQGKQASAVIPLLWRGQEQNAGYVTRPMMEYIGDMLDMPYIRVLEVATFYTMFQLSPVGTKAHIQVCGTTPCMLRGAEDLKKVCQRKIHAEPHHVNVDGTLSWEEVECLGACVNAPMVQVWKDTYEDLTPESLSTLIDDWQAGRNANPGPQNGRQHSMAMGGSSTLTDPNLYGRQRTFTRVEAPPPPLPAPAAPTTGTPVVASAKAPPPVLSAATTLVAAQTVISQSASATVEIKPVPGKSGEKAAAPPPPNYVNLLAQQIKEKKAKKPIAAKSKAPPVKVAKLASSSQSAGKNEGAPEFLAKPRTGKGDDLELIWGVGPGLAKTLNKMGIWHFDQIAAWSAKELKWVDENLKGFRGRASRDEWVPQSKKLSKGWRPENDVGQKPTKKK